MRFDPRFPPLHLHAPEGSRVIGVEFDATGPSLVAVSPDARRIALMGRASAPTLFTTSTPIEHAVVAPRGGMVAWRTSEGLLEVGSIHHRGIVMRLRPEGSE